MKSIKDLVKSTTKTAAKIGLGAAMAFLPYTSNAQDPDGVPLEQIYNQFQKPDVHSQYLGKKQFEYYGSSDVNNNGIPGEAADAEAIRNGVVNDMADVNADGQVNETDAQMIDSYVAGTGKLIGINYLSPEHSVQERKDWIYNLYNNVLIPSHNNVTNSVGRKILAPTPGWVCGNFSEQAIYDLMGMKDGQGFIEKHWEDIPASTFDYKYNARFNLQVDESSATTRHGGAHSIITFPVGDDLEDIKNWYFLDAQTGEDANPGTRFNSYAVDEKVRSNAIGWEGTSKKWGNVRGPPIIKFVLNKDKTVSIEWKNKDYTFQRPAPDTEAPVITGIEDKTLEYQSNLDLSPEALGKPTVTDNRDKNLTATFTDESSQKESGIEKYNYVVNRTWTATDRAGNSNSLEQKLMINDTEAPTADTPKDLFLAYKENLDLSPSAIGGLQNVRDNGEVKEITFTDESTRVMDGSMDQTNYTVTRNWKLSDVVGNETVIPQKITVSDGTKPDYLKISREGKNLSLKYFADANENVKIQLIDMGSGEILKTLDEKVKKGNNTITFPQQTLNGIQVARVIDEDETNVQSRTFVDENAF